MAWIGTWAFAVAGATFPLILLLFPTGRVPSPRWRPVVPWLLGGATLWAVAFYAVLPRPIHPMPGLRVDNPAGIEALRGVGGTLVAIGTIAAILTAVACFVGLFLRFRRARGEERQQLRWLAYVGIFALTLFAAMFALDPLTGGGGSAVEDAVWIIFVASVTIGIPVACGVAILKYRLYELDVVINKTVVSGCSQSSSRSCTSRSSSASDAVAGSRRGSTWLAFGAIALVALVLQPLRTGRSASPTGWSTGSERRRTRCCRSSPNASARRSRWRTRSRGCRGHRDGTGATSAEVWLRIGDGLRLEASSPVSRRRKTVRLPPAIG